MKIRSLAAGIILLLASSWTQAMPMVDATGNISDLIVGGTAYDVVWNFGSSDPSAGDFALFNSNQSFADMFMDAVLAAFNTTGFTGVAEQVFYGVDYALLIGSFVGDNGGGSFYRINSGHGAWSINSRAGWGAVTKSVVPEPATLALFGLGLASFGWSRRKKA